MAMALNLTAGLALATCFATGVHASCTGSADANKAVVASAIDMVWNKDERAAIETYYAADFVDHSADPLVPSGPEAVHIVYGAMRSAFPDLQVAIHEQVAEGDVVASRLLIYGTNSGPFLGAPPTGNPILVRAMRFDRVCDGQITELWSMVDSAAMMAQLRSD